MCKWNDTILVGVLDSTGQHKEVDVDKCIAPLVKVLNQGGFRTIASCCGHGHRPGSIIFADGRELIIAKNWDEGRKIDRVFPDIHGHIKKG